VVETDVEYPTDTGLLYEAVRKVLEGVRQLEAKSAQRQWTDIDEQLRSGKQQLRQLQKLKRSRSKQPEKQEQCEAAIRQAHEQYLSWAEWLVERAAGLEERFGNVPGKYPILLKIEPFIAHAQRQIEQVRRRVLQGQRIAHDEKVFSLFEPHTEWLSKGKAGVPVELGLNVCIVEDQHHFILHHQVMQQQSDADVAVPMVVEARQRFPALKSCSFDQGFHSPDNQTALAELLDELILPRKGRLSATAKAHQQREAFVQGRRQHAAVESAIHALEVHGLDRCPDHGLHGFTRYVALAVVARNLQILGRYLTPDQRAKTPDRSLSIAA